MTDEELDETLAGLERDRDALLESYAEMTPEALDALTPGSAGRCTGYYD
jgi:hypothetical protein